MLPEKSCPRAQALLTVIWFAFTVRTIFYCTAFPLWEGFDEYAHVGVVQHIFHFRDMPDFRAANTSREIAESRKLVPAPWLLHDDSKALLSYEEYWRLPSPDRLERQARLRELPRAWSTEPAMPELPLYEAQQPPLYYWLLLPVYWCVKSLDLSTQVWVLRCITALLASTAIPIAFFTARSFFAKHFLDQRAALGVAVVVASLPQLAIDAFRVSNEGLAIALGSLAVLLMIRLSDSPPSSLRGFGIGLVLGAALLTKVYFLALLPWAAFVLVRAILRDRKERRAA